MRILCAIFVDMYYDKSMRSLEYHTFWPACQELGNARLFQMDRPGIDNRTLNRMFLDTVRRFKPDVVFTAPVRDEWQPGTMGSLDCPTVGWICDSYRADYVRQEIQKYSHVVGTDEKTAAMATAAGKPFLLSTWACNPDFHVPGHQKDLDIVWIGQNSAYRRDHIAALQENFGDRAIVRGWNFPGGPVTWNEYIRLLGRAKIGVSFSKDMAGVPQAKLRDFEVAACGGLLLAEKPNYLSGHLESGIEYVSFSSIEEMIEKAEYFLDHDEEREAIALAGHRRTIKEHTFANRLREVFTWALGS